MVSPAAITLSTLQSHSSPSSCWLAIDKTVWDLTAYAPHHPGGQAIIHSLAGRDATSTYSSVHPPGLLLATLPPECRIGELDTLSLPLADDARTKAKPSSTLPASNLPPLASIINTHDFAHVAQSNLSPKTWAFFSSGATDLATLTANQALLQRLWFRPRLLRNVSSIDTSSTILGHSLRLPLFVSPAAMAKLAHPAGEVALARGALASGIVQVISSNASFSVADILAPLPPSQPTFFQLYVNTNRAATLALLKDLLSHGKRIAGIFITIDASVPGKREADERILNAASVRSAISGSAAANDTKGGGLARSMGGYIDKALCWPDLRWIRDIVGPEMPLVLKGVQSASDAILAAQAGMQGILVSNHGGRTLDGAPPAILTLLEMRKHCPWVFGALEVYIDSGIRRGTDILKCLCLGAKAVGMGRPFLYSLCYGEKGVEHLVEIMRDELETAMRLTGITRVDQCSLDYVNACDVEHMVPGPRASRL